MVDIVSSRKRSQMMPGIRGKNTKPELIIRKRLHAAGFRYRLNDKQLPGKPDLVFPSLNAVIFVNGCFWHAHDCHLFKMPKSRTEFWQEKLSGNSERDRQNTRKLLSDGWRVAIVWECSLKGTGKLLLEELIMKLADWLRSSCIQLELKGAT